MSSSFAGAAGWTVLAHLLRPQGRKGEILAELLTDFPAEFERREQLYLAPAGFDGDRSRARPVRVSRHWLPLGRNHGRVVLALEGIASISQAETLSHLDLIVPTASRVILPEEEEYVDDLIGCVVFDGSTAVGTVTGMDFPSTPDGARRLEAAPPLLTVLTPEGDEVLIPYVQSFLRALSTQEKRIDMQLPEGLLDVNR